MVIHKRAIKKNAPVRLQGAGQGVGSIRRRPAVGGWTRTPLGICLDHEAAEVRDLLVDLVNLGLPPLNNSGIPWIKAVQVSEDLRTTQIDRHSQAHTPRTKHIRDAGQLRKEAVVNNPWIGIHIIEGATGDADRGQQTCVFHGAR